MSIYEYDQEKHLRMEREDAKAEGITEGRRELLEELIKKKLLKDKSPEQIAEELEEDKNNTVSKRRISKRRDTPFKLPLFF